MKPTFFRTILLLAVTALTIGQTTQQPSPAAAKALAQHRQRIDAIDQQVISLLNERAKIALEIGRIRQRENIPPASAKSREEEVLRNVMKQSESPLSPEAARRIYERIIAEMVEIQRLDAAKEK